MKRESTMYLRAAVWILGLIVIALCIFALPAGIRSQKWSAYKLIIEGMYVTVVPLFVAMYQTLKLLDYIDANTAFSEASVTALKYVKYCGYVICGLYVAIMPYIFHIADTVGSPGGIVLGSLVAGTSFVIATSAGVLQKLLKNVIDIKSENDLTV